jgi:hypothetical protein
MELAVHAVFRAGRGGVADRCFHRLSSHGTGKPQFFHQAGDGASGNLDPFPVQLPPDFTHAVDLKVCSPDAPDLRAKRRVPFPPFGSTRWISKRHSVGAVGRWRDRQNPADRLDAINLTMLVDEHLHFLKGRSSSA